MLHVSEYLAEHLGELPLRGDGARRVTYQDPCRLGRQLGVYDAPRRVLGAVPGVELAEMRRSGPAAICCAGGTWTHCSRYAKQIQVERLREARATGTEVLLTACPKCRIHLRCAMQDPRLQGEIEIEMRDVAELVADALLQDTGSREPSP
jgi:Fe-S oxidoreductase